VVHLGGESSKTVKRLSMSSSGSQLTLWADARRVPLLPQTSRLRRGVLRDECEAQWHRLRAFLARRRHDPDSLAKAEESQILVAAAGQAWHDTNGGLTCPPKPW